MYNELLLRVVDAEQKRFIYGLIKEDNLGRMDLYLYSEPCGIDLLR